MNSELLSRTNTPETLPETARLLRSVAAVIGWNEVQAAELIVAACGAATAGFRLLWDRNAKELVLLADERARRYPVPESCTQSQIVSALRDPGGAPLHLEQDLRDAREQIAQLQSELDETNRGVMALYAELDDRASKLKRADDLKSRFLSYASHELRTPLNGISGLARLLLARHPQGEEHKQLIFVQKAAQEMREVVDDLLDLAKVEAGKITVHPSEFGLELVFGALRGMFRPLLSADSVDLHFEDTSSVPSVYSDEAKVVQILRNLISNALKFTQTGEVRVWAQIEFAETVRISVKDTGIGIAPEDHARVFDEFTQIDHPLQRKLKGTGLGLPLCRRLADLLGGRVELESEFGAGSTFSLILPLVYLPGDAMAVPPSSGDRPFTVLHVEDVEIDRYLVQNLLCYDRNLRLLHAEDGLAAIEMARSEQPDLIILDLNLPRLSGSDVLEILRADPATASIPVAILTGAHVEVGSDAPLVFRHAIAILSKDSLADASGLLIERGPPLRLSVKKAGGGE